MAPFIGPSSSFSCLSSTVKCALLSVAGNRRHSIRLHYSQAAATIISPSPLYDQDLAYRKHEYNIASVKKMLSKDSDRLQAMVAVDSLKRLCIDHHFTEEIERLLSSLYRSHHVSLSESSGVFDLALSFRLLREGGYDISSDMFESLFKKDGEFDTSLGIDIKGLMSLHDASHLNMGEEVLYKAQEFTSRQLKSLTNNYLEPSLAKIVTQSLEHPYHLSLQQYKARHHLTYLKRSFQRNLAMEDLAMTEFQLNKMLHQSELQQFTRWWRDLGLAKELTFARDQPLKWYMWSMTCLQDGPAFSKHRLEITKVVSFIYIVDDIFDMIGSVQELALFTEAVRRWDLAAASSLPSYMRSCYVALYTVIHEMAALVEREHGSNPVHHFRKAWVMLFDAFMVEAKWFAARRIPTADDYLRNGMISSGVHVFMVHMFFLLGGRNTDSVDLLEPIAPIISSSAKILRLWDDLGSAEDEEQDGFDGSYKVCYMKDNPWCSSLAATEHIKGLISDAWEELNIECFSRRSFSPVFTQTSLNCARMVRVMYSYDEGHKLPALEEYTNMLLL